MQVNINSRMSTQQSMALVITLFFYAASLAYVFIMDVWVIQANHINWTDLSVEDRIWIMGPMAGLQAMGIIVFISNMVDEANRYACVSRYQGDKFSSFL